MSADVQPRPTPASAAGLPGPRQHARRGVVLLAVAAFNVWLWVTRAYNLIEDPTPRTTGFIVVHALLYTAAFGAAIVTGVIGWRMRLEGRRVAHDGVAT